MQLLFGLLESDKSLYQHSPQVKKQELQDIQGSLLSTYKAPNALQPTLGHS